MKKFIVLNILLMLLLTACYDRDTVTMGDITDPVLTSIHNNSQFVVTDENIEGEFDTFRWTAAGFGFDHRNPDYILRMDLASNNFQNSVSLGTTQDLELTILNSRINQNLLAMGVIDGESVNVEFKLFANIHADVSTESNIVSVAVTPMEMILALPTLYVAGDHNGWDFSDQIYSLKSNDIYEGYIYMDNGDDWNKIKMSFQPNWDDAGAVIGDPDESGTSGTLKVGDWGGNNINVIEGIGYYKLIANLDNLTYQVFITNWAITGDFNGWSFSPMQFDIDSNTWSITTNLTAGGFKFIANENWSLIYGDEELDGLLDPGTDGNNIQIAEAGSYTIVMNLHDVPFSYTVTKN